MSLFALSEADNINVWKALIILFVIHFLLYPASNGYNSYMDRDEGSIGGIETPLPVSRELYYTSIVMDIIGTLASLLISPMFAALYVVYIMFSRLYSYRGIRLKKYPVIGYLTVILNQGSLVYYMVYSGAGETVHAMPWPGLLISALLIGAFYPITQVYQHEQDRRDGVITISYKLGIKGTFVYCAILYAIAFGLLAWHYLNIDRFVYFLILQAWFLPVIIRFVWWTWQCWQKPAQANYRNTMRMNWLAAVCTNLAFISLIIIKNFG